MDFRIEAHAVKATLDVWRPTLERRPVCGDFWRLLQRRMEGSRRTLAGVQYYGNSALARSQEHKPSLHKSQAAFDRVIGCMPDLHARTNIHRRFNSPAGILPCRCSNKHTVLA